MKKISNLLKAMAFVFVLFIAVIGFAQAETNESNTAKQALNVRYDHLVCKVDFAAAQNTAITTYIGENNATTSALAQVQSDLAQLEIYKESNNQSGFDTYVQDTFKYDYKILDKQISNIKKDFKSYNLTNTSKEGFKTDLKAAVKVYSECVSAKEIAMAKIAEKQYEHADEKWTNDIEQMRKKNMTVADVEAVQIEMNARLDRLKELIASGNSTAIRAYEQEMRLEHLHLWARFEEGRIKGYMNKVEAISGNDTQFKNLKDKFEEIGKYTAPGYKFREGDAEKVWDGLKDSSQELRETSKEIIKVRMEEQKQAREQQREEQKDARENKTDENRDDERENISERDGKREQNDRIESGIQIESNTQVESSGKREQNRLRGEDKVAVGVKV